MSSSDDMGFNEALRDDAAAFVLGAMPEIEAQAFRREMMRNCELGRYVTQLEAVGDMLLASAPPVTVPDAIGTAIINEARRDLEVRELLESPRAGSEVSREQPGLLARLFRPAIGLGLAAVIAVGAFFVGQNVTDQPSGESLTASFAAQTSQPVTGTVRSIDGGAEGAVIEIAGLDTDIGSDVYQAWVLKNGVVTPSSLFSVDAEGRGNSVVNQDISDAEAVMITREPAGGSAQPTTDVLARADV
ncbi:MAG: anti-sigma factor domain-containing protein [Solirubrobacterales bacterium]